MRVRLRHIRAYINIKHRQCSLDSGSPANGIDSFQENNDVCVV
jgi:hypothetical protein